MNKTLYHLACRNLRKYKRHYIFVFIVIVLLSTFFMSYVHIEGQRYDAIKLNDWEKYGKWFEKLDILSDSYNEMESFMSKEYPKAQYGYIYQIGILNDGQASYIDKEIYDLCRLTLREGRYPLNENEIMVSRNYLDEKGLKINQKIISDLEGYPSELTIVGVLNVPLHTYFPDIYFYKLSSFKYMSVVIDRDVLFTLNMPDSPWHIDIENVDNNSHGHSSEPNIDHLQWTFGQMFVIEEMLFLTGFILAALCFSTYKRRTKELTLLRGIGMTNKQMVIMSIYEMICLSVIGITIGIIFSMIITYQVALYFEQEYHQFVYECFDISYIYQSVGLFIFILLTVLYPVYSSSKRSLSGTFDGQHFQYIQVRYRKLKYQTKWRLALREMRVNKKITIILFILFGLLSTYYLGTLIKPMYKEGEEITFEIPFESFQYLSVHADTKEKADLLATIPLENHIYHEYTLKEDSFGLEENDYRDFESPCFISLDDISWLEHCRIYGHKPQNQNEILMGSYSENVFVKKGVDTTEGIQLGIGYSVYVNGEQYEIVGKINPNEEYNDYYVFEFLYYLPDTSFFVLPETAQKWGSQYDSYTVRFYFENQEDRLKGKKVIEQFINDNQIENCEVNDPQVRDISIQEENSLQDLLPDVSIYYLILPFVVGLIFCYFVNKNQMYNQRNDYGIYQLIGMTKMDLMIKQLWKALLLAFMIFIHMWIWVVIYCSYYHVIVIPILEIIGSTFMMGIVGAIIYCMPLLSILKNDYFLELREND